MVQCGGAHQIMVRIMVLVGNLLKKRVPFLITIIFFAFAIVNINDPDGIIWVFTYIIIGCLPWVKKIDQKLIYFFAILISIIGLFIVFGLLNSVMPKQFDNQMVNLWEYQREGLGLILGALWLVFGKKLIIMDSKI